VKSICLLIKHNDETAMNFDEKRSETVGTCSFTHDMAFTTSINFTDQSRDFRIPVAYIQVVL